MRSSYKKAIVAASAAIANLGVLRMTSAQTLITGDQSAVVDGWTITGWPGVSLSVSSNSNGISIEKSANFTVANTGFPIGFSPVSGGSPATSIDIQDEQIANNTGQSFTGFDFILLNTGTANATFASGSTNPFSPPTGYTGFTSADGGQELIYAGSQDSGTTSDWGTDGSTLLIDAPAGSDFSLKELPTFGSGGGGGGGPSSVPMPSATSQSLVGLVGLALFGAIRLRKRRSAAAY
jgi:hypothetical protein